MSDRLVSRAVLRLAVRHVTAHRRMAAVVVVAVACGVASILAAQLLYQSVVRSHEDTLHRFAGRAALQVTNGTSGIAEEVVEALRAVPGVQAVAPSVEGFVSMADGSERAGERLFVYGVDLLEDQHVRDYETGTAAVVDDPLVFLASPDSVALTAEFARARHLRLGDPLSVLTPGGVAPLTVRALLGRQRGPASALDGRLAVVDLSVAQELLRMSGRVSTIAITTTRSADVDDVARAVTVAVGGRRVVEPPRARAAAFARMLASYRYGLLVAATIAMVVAVAFVFTVATMAVAERRRELGLLRVVGLRRADLGALVVGEILAVAGLGALLGGPLGIGLARLLLASFGSTTAALYGDGADAVLGVEAPAMAWSTALGVAAAIAAIVAPVRAVTRVSPLDAVRTSVPAPTSYARLAGRWWRGPTVLGAVLVVWIARDHLSLGVGAAGTIAILGMLAGSALVVMDVMAPAIVLGNRLAAGWGRALPLLAWRRLHGDVRNTAFTCATLLVALAGGLGVASWITSLDATLQAAFDGVFANVDVVVSAGGDPFATEATRMPMAVAAGIAALPEVAFADPVRIDAIAFEGARASVIASDATLYRDGRRRLVVTEGDEAAVAAAVASGVAVVVNQTFARRFGRKPGDVVTLPTPTGPLRLPIAGIHLELVPGDLGTIRLDRTLYRRWWKDETASVIEVSLTTPSEHRRVLDVIRERWGTRHQLVVLTLEELRAEYGAMLRRLATLVYPLLGVALGSALVGTVSGRVVSGLARRRVGGLLRAVGATGRQLGRLGGLEAGIVAGFAVVFASVAGAWLGHLQVVVFLRGMLAMSVVYAYPRTAGWMAVTMLVVVSVAAGWVIERRAARGPLVDALRWD